MRKNQKYSQEEMYQSIKQWKASGLSQTKYSAQQGISRDVFKYWLKKYRTEKGISNTSSSAPFIPVEINSLSAPSCLTNEVIEIIITFTFH